jgi:hypothetical protein
MISSEKVMVTIAWNPNGFHEIEILPKGQTFNTDYGCLFVLPKLLKMAKQFRG